MAFVLHLGVVLGSPGFYVVLPLHSNTGGGEVLNGVCEHSFVGDFEVLEFPHVLLFHFQGDLHVDLEAGHAVVERHATRVVLLKIPGREDPGEIFANEGGDLVLDGEESPAKVNDHLGELNLGEDEASIEIVDDLDEDIAASVGLVARSLSEVLSIESERAGKRPHEAPDLVELLQVFDLVEDPEVLFEVVFWPITGHLVRTWKGQMKVSFSWRLQSEFSCLK